MLRKIMYALGFGMGCFVSLVSLGIILGFSWFFVCGVVKLVTLCFGWMFSWKIATGIWIIFFVIGGLISEWGEKK